MPKPIPITFLADAENRIPIAMAPSLEQAGYVLQPFQSKAPINEIVVIFSPVWDGEHYQSVEGVWARYLAIDHPVTKLIVIGNGMQNCDDPSFIDLFALPDDWKGVIENLPPASRFKDNAPIFTGGMEMTERLSRFLKGHGNESLAEVCKNLLSYVAPGIDVVSLDKDGSIIREVVKEVNSGYAHSLWTTLHARWANYSPLFVFLPFHATFEEIKLLMEELGYIFDGKETDEERIRALFAALTQRLERMRTLLNKLMVYVRE